MGYVYSFTLRSYHVGAVAHLTGKQMSRRGHDARLPVAREFEVLLGGCGELNGPAHVLPLATVLTGRPSVGLRLGAPLLPHFA